MSGKTELKINSKFAEKYDKYRQREELQRLKDKYGDQGEETDSSSSDSDDDSEVELDPKLDRDFYRTLSLLKKKDPKIYQADTKFYNDEEASGSSDAPPSTSKKAVKPMFLKDYERKVILERGGKFDDDDEEEEDDEEAARRRERAASPSYIQEQEDLKESFRQFIQDSDDEAGGEVEQLLTRRTKTQQEKDREEEDYVEWLKGQAEMDGPEEVQDMKYLRDYWNDPALDEKERYLRDFILNKAYLDDQDHRIPSYDEVVQDEVEDSSEEGESFLEKQEDFERHYNFRFEEPDAQRIKTYPRSIATSVRSKDERRKRKREEVKERKAKEKEQKREQLKQLKNLKQKEIQERLRRLGEISGPNTFTHTQLEGDFDPQEHDRLMEKVFGQEYYGEEEGEKPQFDDDELEDHWNWDTWTGEGGEEEGGEDEEGGEEEEEYGSHEPNCDDPDFIMDADYDPNQPSSSKKRKEKKKRRMEETATLGKRRRKSHFAEVITKDKPAFDPQEKSFDQYLDEYYKLDYEDIIDDLPCRFHYRNVLANDFGLTTDEILGADEKDLNRWCSLKKTCMFRSDREEQCDLKNYQIKARDDRKKKEVLSSFYSMEDDAQQEKRARQRNKKRGEEPAGPSQVSTVRPEPIGEDQDFLVPKKSRIEENLAPAVEEKEREDVAAVKTARTEKPGVARRKRRQPGGRLIASPFRVKMGGREFSGQRLKAYGLNPRRMHFRQVGRQKRKAQAGQKSKP